MDAYALARADVPPGVAPVLLNQNESALPPSPRAIAAAAEAAATAHLYSDPDWTSLRAAISDVHKLDAESLMIGAGSMELIGALIGAFAGPGDQVLSTAHGYAFFRTAAQLAEADYAAAPEPDKTISVGAVLDTVTPATKIVCIANPGNPTGTRIGRDALVRLREGLRDDILLIIDEAYAEFADHLDEQTFDLIARGNTVVLRTFSKAYALAGMRVGWGAFPPAVARETRKRLNPNNVSTPAQAAATAAMRDQAYRHALCGATARRRDDFAAACRDLGIASPVSFTNFVLLDFCDAGASGRADEYLRAQGVVMRPMGGYGLGHCLRATVGSEDDMMKAAETLRAWREREDG